MASGFRRVASLDSRRNPPGERGLPRKCLKMSQDLWRAGDGGFHVASPVKTPDAGQAPDSAPPYTDRAREEPLEGDQRAPALVTRALNAVSPMIWMGWPALRISSAFRCLLLFALPARTVRS